MNSATKVLNIAQSLISFDTSSTSGINAALKWLKQWSKNNLLAIKTFPKTKAILIETNPHAKHHFCFVTHLDVVPADNWIEAFMPQVSEGVLIGRGAVDDKGPLAICLEIVNLSKNLSNSNVSCLIITDEETSNIEISKVVSDNHFRPDFSLVVDGGTHELVDIGQKGIINCELSLTAPGGHSAFEEQKNSAIVVLLDVISQLQNKAASSPHHHQFSNTFINISSLQSATVDYGLPDRATAKIQIQFPPPQKKDDWLNILSELTKQHPTLKVKTTWTSEPHLVTDKKTLQLLSNAGLKSITTGGNNLAKDLVLAGIPAVSHCPVTEYVAHCHGEKISLTDLTRGVSLYQQLITLFMSQNT